MFNSIHHDGSPRYVSPADPQIGDEVTLRLRAGLDVPLECVLLRTCPDGEQRLEALQALEPQHGAACRWWQVTLTVRMPLTSYRFLLFTAQGAYWYNGSGLHRQSVTDAEDFRLLAGFQAPQWARRSVFYQVFPDRFFNGDPSCDVRDGEYEYRGFPARARGWGQPPTQGSRAAMVEFYGGDLAGIIQKLDYLQDLGVDALYLNPVFTAYSNHRYDVVDYAAVDPHLGGDAALAALRRATAERGLRYILDIVPNHCGLLHPWFLAAQADPQAPTAEYFTFRQRPDEYECWLGVRSLPKLNYRSQALRDVMYAGPQSIFRRWLRPPYAADGWRIDVANMLARQGPDQLGPEIGRGIRQAVKEENPQAYLLGENFFDASHQLQGDCWDAVMNYSGFAMPLWYWLGGFMAFPPGQPPIADPLPWTAETLAASWQAHRAAIPWAVARQQFNLVGSHDVPRLLASLGGDLARLRLAAVLMFTYVGTPCLYYGDEVGLGVGQNADPRACMPWDPADWNADLRSFYQALIRLRHAAPALNEGGFQVLLAQGDTLAYLRDTDAQWVIVVAQRAGLRPASALAVAPGGISDGVEFNEYFSGRTARVENGCLPLPELSPGVQVWGCDQR
ncbi:MAG TPA: alpha-amylase family glycosyl hydrolase [Anaerolineales bacterium]|nr:alpha-amylase family glycosyl hydrolase [Anaerolineales bacterium]